MQFQGFENVSNMEGGYSKWVDSGFAGDKPDEELKVACKFRPWESLLFSLLFYNYAN